MYYYHIAQNGSGKTLANLVNLEQFAKVLSIQIYIIKLWVDCVMNKYCANSGEHPWLKLFTTKSTWTSFNYCHSLCQYVSLGLPCSLSQGSYAPSLRAFQIEHLHISVIPSLHLNLYKCTYHFSTTCNDKINNCGFKFNVASE